MTPSPDVERKSPDDPAPSAATPAEPTTLLLPQLCSRLAVDAIRQDKAFMASVMTVANERNLPGDWEIAVQTYLIRKPPTG